MSPLACLPPAVVDALPTLSPSAVRVAVAVASFMGKSGECWPSRTALSERSGVRKPRNIGKALRELADCGLLEVKRRCRRSSVYRWKCHGTAQAAQEHLPQRGIIGETQCAPKGQQEVPERGIPVETECAPKGQQEVPQRGIIGETECAPEGQQEVPQKGTQKGTTEEVRTTSTAHSTPPELADLELYAADRKLCKRWGQLLRTWQRTYPGLAVLDEVCLAHAWEVENVRKRKTDRARFLGRWLRRSEERRQRDAPVADEPPPMSTEYVDWLEARAAEREARDGR